jgi:hypothetical protein
VRERFKRRKRRKKKGTKGNVYEYMPVCFVLFEYSYYIDHGHSFFFFWKIVSSDMKIPPFC